MRILHGATCWAFFALAAGSLYASDALPQLSPANTISQPSSPAFASPAEMPLAESAAPLAAGVPTTIAVPESSLIASSKESPSEYRSTQQEQIAQQADRQTRHGFELAGRGAYFAARSEFINSLRLVAEGLDAEQSNNSHSQALAAALTALKESEDFLPTGSQLETGLDLPAIISIHRTPALKNQQDGLTAMSAHRCYLTYAQEQFAVAAGNEVAGSMALHGLGKLHTSMARKKVTAIPAAESKAMAFFQSALLVYSNNYMAANDLGVMLAQCGRWSDARTMLEYSLSLRQQSTALRNLAAVYRQLGQRDAANRAENMAVFAAKTEATQRRNMSIDANGNVQWVDQQAFAKNTSGVQDWPANTPTITPANAAAKNTATSAAGRPVRGTPAYKR